MRLIVFDCDGTLVDSQHMIAEAMKTAFAASGRPAPDRAKMLRHIGLSVSEAMQAMTGISEPAVLARLSADYREAFAALRREGCISDPLFPGAHEALKALSACDDVVLGIATGKSRRGVQMILEREGLTDVFTTIQTADDAPSKPHPAMIHQAIDEAGVTAGETYMIGDTSFDMLMAEAASACAIGVAWGYHDPAELLRAGAAMIVQDFQQLADALISAGSVAAA